MTSPVKILFALAGLAVLLFVVVIVAVALLVDPNDYRPYLVNAVENATGRSFELEGELGLEVLPCCSVSVGRARLDNPAGFPETEFLSFRHASASLNLWPLLVHRQLSIGTVTLDGVTVNLTRLPDGRDNWTLTAESGGPATAQPAGQPVVAGLRVAAVELQDGQVRYQDQQTGLGVTVTGLRLETGAIDYGKAGVASFPLDGSLTAREDGRDAAARMTLETRLAMTDDEVTLQSPVLVVVAEGAAIPGGEVNLRVAADTLATSKTSPYQAVVNALTVDLSAADSAISVTGQGAFGTADGSVGGTFTVQETSPRRLLAAMSDDPYEPADDLALTRVAATGQWSMTPTVLFLRDLDVRLDASHVTGNVEVKDLTTGAAHVDLDLDQLDLDRYLPADTPEAAAAVPGGGPAIPLDALAGLIIDGNLRVGSLTAANVALDGVKLHLDSDGDRLSLTLVARGLGGNMAVDGRGSVTGTEPALSGRLEAHQLSLRTLLTDLGSPPETADANALTRFSGATEWSLTPNAAALTNMRWKLDDTEATGSLHVDDLGTLASRVDVALDHLNLDGYLPPVTDNAAPGEPVQLPVDAIRRLRLTGRLRAKTLTFRNATVGPVLVEANGKDGVLRLDPITAGAYGGRYRGSAVVNAAGSTAQVMLQQELAAVQIGDLLKSLFDTDVLTGALSLSLSGNGEGNTLTDVLRGLGADVSFDLQDGVYRGANVRYEIERARALLKKEPAPKAPAVNETPLRALTGQGRIVNGVLQTSKLTATTPTLRLLGEGGLNLLDRSLDYRLDAEVIKSAASSSSLDELTGTTIPITLRGPLRSPKVNVDLKGLVTNRLRDEVEKRVRSALLDKLGDEASKQPADRTPSAGTEHRRPDS